MSTESPITLSILKDRNALIQIEPSPRNENTTWWRDYARDILLAQHDQGIYDWGFKAYQLRCKTNKEGWKVCSLLEGQIGVSVTCSAYEDRPKMCSMYEPGGKGCLDSRKWSGLSGLNNEQVMRNTGEY